MLTSESVQESLRHRVVDGGKDPAETEQIGNIAINGDVKKEK